MVQKFCILNLNVIMTWPPGGMRNSCSIYDTVQSQEVVHTGGEMYMYMA